MDSLKKLLKYNILTLFKPDKDTSENDLKVYRELLLEQDIIREDYSKAQKEADRYEYDLDDLAFIKKFDYERLDKSFAEMLKYWLEEKAMAPSKLYRRANINKQTYSRIMRNPNNPPTKPIAMACAVALKLKRDEAEDLLKRAGFAISTSNITDIIFGTFIDEGIYDIDRINECIFEYDGVLLGSKNK